MPTGTQGPLYPASGTDAGGSYPWATPQNIVADDSTLAGSYNPPSSPSATVSNRLTGTSYGFTVPGGATINGITVTVNWFSDSTNYQGMENEILLLKAGVAGGTNKSTGLLLGFTFPNYYSYGNPVNLWGRTWTAADINSAGFGAAVSVAPAGPAGGIVWVDSIAITVYYYVGAGGNRNPGMII